ncbi:MAG: hypothetical protein QOF63_1593 [Thermoanaerobaculia bacterium]|nr:hypothetical protein [Thermoanaerobaculia bacterium]
MLDRERRKVSIGNQIAGDVGVQQQASEHGRMIFRRFRDPDLWLIEPLHHLLPRRRGRERSREYARIRGQTKKRKRCLPWNANSGPSIQLLFEPHLRAAMLRYVFKLRVK